MCAELLTYLETNYINRLTIWKNIYTILNKVYAYDCVCVWNGKNTSIIFSVKTQIFV